MFYRNEIAGLCPYKSFLWGILVLHCLDFYHYSILAVRNWITFLMAEGLDCICVVTKIHHFTEVHLEHIFFLFFLQVLSVM